MLNQKGLVHILLLILLLVGIIAGVFLVSKSGYQLFQPKATSKSIEFIEGDCVKTKGDEKVLTCDGPVQFKLISPLESDSASDASFQLVKPAYAQTAGGKDYFCDPTLQDNSLIYHKECNSFFDLLCNWGLFGAKWEDQAEFCEIGLECQLISQGLFDSGARCVAPKEESKTYLTAPVQAVPTRQPDAFIPPGLTPRPAASLRTTPPAARTTPRPTAAPRIPTPTPTESPVGGSEPASETVSKNATLSLFPASWRVNKGCSYSVQVRLNTAQAETNGADIVLNYDPAKLEATTITPGTIFDDYSSQYIDPSGKVLITGLAGGSDSYTGLGIFATVNFTVLEDALEGATKVEFDFDPNDKSKVTDSNVVEEGTNADLLTSVSNGEYTIGSGECPAGSEEDSSSTQKSSQDDTAERTTKYYRISETPDKFEDEDFGWKVYKAGGVRVEHTFKESGNTKFIYAQFKDNKGGIINAKPYPVQINLVEETSSSEKSKETSKETPSNEKSSEKPEPVSETSSPGCDLKGEIGNWRNCSKEGLKQTLKDLPQATRDLLPNDALIIFNNKELLDLFSKQRLSSLNSKYLVSFSNGDLLAIQVASGKDKKTFFSGFDCSRLISLAQDIKDLFKAECGF